MPNSIMRINGKTQNLKHNMKINNLKNWMIIILIAALIASMLVIIKHFNAENELQQKIYRHSEITDTL